MNIIELFSLGPVYDAITDFLTIFDIIRLSATCKHFNNTLISIIQKPKLNNISNYTFPNRAPLPCFYNSSLYYEYSPQDFDHDPLRYILYLIFSRNNGFIDIDIENRTINKFISLEKIQEIDRLLKNPQPSFCDDTILNDDLFPNGILIQETLQYDLDWDIDYSGILIRDLRKRRPSSHIIHLDDIDYQFYNRVWQFLRSNKYNTYPTDFKQDYYILSMSLYKEISPSSFIGHYFCSYPDLSIGFHLGRNFLFYRDTMMYIHIIKGKMSGHDYIVIRDAERKIYPIFVMNLTTKKISITFE